MELKDEGSSLQCSSKMSENLNTTASSHQKPETNVAELNDDPIEPNQLGTTYPHSNNSDHDNGENKINSDSFPNNEVYKIRVPDQSQYDINDDDSLIQDSSKMFENLKTDTLTPQKSKILVAELNGNGIESNQLQTTSVSHSSNANHDDKINSNTFSSNELYNLQVPDWSQYFNLTSNENNTKDEACLFPDSSKPSDNLNTDILFPQISETNVAEYNGNGIEPNQLQTTTDHSSNSIHDDKANSNSFANNELYKFRTQDRSRYNLNRDENDTKEDTLLQHSSRMSGNLKTDTLTPQKSETLDTELNSDGITSNQLLTTSVSHSSHSDHDKTKSCSFCNNELYKLQTQDWSQFFNLISDEKDAIEKLHESATQVKHTSPLLSNQVHKLNSNDMHTYGLHPKNTALVTVVCNYCSEVYKLFGFKDHIRLRHPIIWDMIPDDTIQLIQGNLQNLDTIDAALPNNETLIMDIDAYIKFISSTNVPKKQPQKCTYKKSTASSSKTLRKVKKPRRKYKPRKKKSGNISSGVNSTFLNSNNTTISNSSTNTDLLSTINHDSQQTNEFLSNFLTSDSNVQYANILEATAELEENFATTLSTENFSNTIDSYTDLFFSSNEINEEINNILDMNFSSEMTDELLDIDISLIESFHNKNNSDSTVCTDSSENKSISSEDSAINTSASFQTNAPKVWNHFNLNSLLHNPSLLVNTEKKDSNATISKSNYEEANAFSSNSVSNTNSSPSKFFNLLCASQPTSFAESNNSNVCHNASNSKNNNGLSDTFSTNNITDTDPSTSNFSSTSYNNSINMESTNTINNHLNNDINESNIFHGKKCPRVRNRRAGLKPKLTKQKLSLVTTKQTNDYIKGKKVENSEQEQKPKNVPKKRGRKKKKQN